MTSKEELFLKDLFVNYGAKIVMKKLSSAALRAASNCSDDGLKDKSKELVVLSASLDDLILGRPFLI